MPRQIIFGENEGIKEGDWFEGRKEMMPSSFHRNWGTGIDGNGTEGTVAEVPAKSPSDQGFFPPWVLSKIRTNNRGRGHSG